MRYVLVVSQRSNAADIIAETLGSAYRVESVTTLDASFDKFKSKRHEYTFVDLEMLASPGEGEADFRELLKRFWRIFPTAEIIVLTPDERLRDAVAAVKAGASGYLTFPLDAHELRFLIDRIDSAVRMQSELDYLRDEFWRHESLVFLRTNSPAMREVFAKVRSVVQTDTTVLLSGETGTGKGVIANLIHQNSRRRGKQFISVHCGAIPENLLESELFGHEKGAFTGAVRRKLGRFEIADGGTIFLDEIGTVSSAMQVKLLQVLQDRTFQRVGGEAVLQADVRIIAATNADLKKMCDEGSFRKDLYYRLNVFPIEIPALRERIADIPLLIQAFLKKLNRFHGKNIVDVEPEVLTALRRYPWPGNIRELENLIERAYILEPSGILTAGNFPAELFGRETSETALALDTSLTLEEVRRQHLAHIERQYLSELLLKYRGRIKETAEAAGVGVRQLHKLMTKYGLLKENFK